MSCQSSNSVFAVADTPSVAEAVRANFRNPEGSTTPLWPSLGYPLGGGLTLLPSSASSNAERRLFLRNIIDEALSLIEEDLPLEEEEDASEKTSPHRDPACRSGSSRQ